MDVECKDLNGLAESNIGDGLEGASNEKTLVETEESKISLPLDENNLEEDNVGDADKTSEAVKPVVLPNVPQKIENLPDSTRNIDQVYENGKRKIKEEKPPTKVVVRRLPPSMTKETFLEQVSPLQSYDYVYFVNGDPSYGIHSFSRAYINFINQEDLFTFTRTFDNYVFLDSKGQEYPAIVEFSPFQRVPKQRSKKKDTLTGSIESDPMYISFKENFLAEALENSKPGAKTMKQHYFETEISTAEEVNTTPLLEFLKQRRAEKARIRDERREEKKRKDAERKLKQKSKDKKGDGEEEETKDVKVLQTKDRRDIKDKERDNNNKGIKKKEEKDKSLKENRTREFKNRSGKSYQEERIRQAERREERKKETSIIFERKSESQCSDSGKEPEKSETSENTAPPPIQEEKNRTFIEKKRMYESKRKNDSEDWKGDGDADRRSGGKTDRNRPERRQRERERKRREEFASRKGYDKKLEMEKKKPKIYKTFPSNECGNETKESNNSENDKNNKLLPHGDETAAENIQNKLKQKQKGNNQQQIIESLKAEDKCKDKNESVKSQRRKSLESGNITDLNENEESFQTNIKRRSSLESGESTAATMKLLQTKVITNECDEKSSNLAKNKFSEETSPNSRVEKKAILIKAIVNDNLKKYKSLVNQQTVENREDQSKESEDCLSEQGKHEVYCNKANIAKKNLELSNITDSTSRNKDPRTDRRIRNKDRPSLQIYRPGMGKFSKQRLEKEKVLGSSTEVESPSHSPSPTPKVKFPP